MKTITAVSILVSLLALFLYWLLAPISASLYLPLLASKRILITGASQGIGKELVGVYAKNNASDITIVSRSFEKLQVVKNEVLLLYPQVKIHIIAADCSSKDTSYAVVKESIDLMGGGLDVLILNHITTAKFGPWLNKIGPLAQKLLIDTFETNTFSYIWLATAAMDALQLSGGQIGVVSSLAGHIGTPNVALYSASKHALHGFFNALRLEFKILGINNVHITTCAIGATDTPGASFVKENYSSSVKWDSAVDAAVAIAAGVAGKKREIFHPHSLVFPATVIYSILPSLMDFFLIKAQK